jgi:nucleotide-binding universal stress UspA family protein
MILINAPQIRTCDDADMLKTEMNMSYKSILTVVTNPATAEASVSAAAHMALGFDAHLEVMALGVDQSQVGYAYIGAGAVLTEFSLERAEADARAAADAATAVLAGMDPTLRYSVETVVAEMGSLTAVVGNAASFVDLVVQCRPYNGQQNYKAEAIVEAALFEGRAAVLIIPETLIGKTNKLKYLATPRRVLLAWNQSSEALAAAKRALPLLKQADLVDVTVVDPPARGPERSDPGGLLCQYLVRHGVKAQVSVLAKTMPKISDVLARHVLEEGCDMMVMGAYGHSRLREAVLGGATRAVLETATIPVLMAH